MKDLGYLKTLIARLDLDVLEQTRVSAQSQALRDAGVYSK